jgi:hypothetical protein
MSGEQKKAQQIQTDIVTLLNPDIDQFLRVYHRFVCQRK